MPRNSNRTPQPRQSGQWPCGARSVPRKKPADARALSGKTCTNGPLRRPSHSACAILPWPPKASPHGMILRARTRHHLGRQRNQAVHRDGFMPFYPLHPIQVSIPQVQVHVLLRDGALARSDALVKQQLRLHLRHRAPLYRCGVDNNRIEIELLKVYLLGNVQPPVLCHQPQQPVFMLLVHLCGKEVLLCKGNKVGGTGKQAK